MDNIFYVSLKNTYCGNSKEKPRIGSGVVGCDEGVGYLVSQGRPTDIGFQLAKTCYPCSR